jgi:peptidoglycan/xylan/chitin deacetylase (PgdA/CDA1 family)
MYHEIRTADQGHGSTDYFAVPLPAFERQLQLLRSAGLGGASIEDVLHGRGGSVAISFDDGEISQALHAFPALARMGMTATFFITTGWVGTARYASWDQLREMKAAGMSIQSHTHSHPFLSELSREQVRDELRRSRELLDERLGQRTTMLAFPGGDAPRDEHRDLLAASGYEVVATSRWGRNRGAERGAPRYVARCTMRGASADAAFLAVARGDQWLHLKRRTRERILAFLRASLGPTRYATLRRQLLDRGGASH